MATKILTQRLKLSEIKVSWKDLQEEAIKEVLRSPSIPYRSAGDIPFIRKFYVQEKKVTKGLPEGQVRHYISTIALDRDHEIMMSKGVKLKNYKKNPMVLWSHNPSDPENIIGKNVEIEHDERGIVALTQFILTRPKAASIYNLFKEGWLKMWSVGFIPLKGHKPDKDEGKRSLADLMEGPPKQGEVRYVHDAWELLEYSACAVPSNPEAATLEVAKGYDLSDDLVKEMGLNLENINRLKAKLKGGEEDGKKIIDLGALGKDDKKKEELEEEEKDEDKAQAEIKGAIPYTDHGAADEGTAWDGPREVREADVGTLKIICAWYDSGNADKKSSYKLPHHRAGDKKAVWRGVSAAMGALLGARGGVAIPEGDRKGVYNHLKSHYKHWDKKPPEFKGYSEEELAKMFPEIKAKYECECIDCGYKMGSDEHCADIKCPKCGGEMRRVERPGPGRYIEDEGDKVDVNGLKSGRVISAKNRKLLIDCHGKMNSALTALDNLLRETAVEEDSESEAESEAEAVGGKSEDKKLAINFSLGKLKTPKPPVKAVMDEDDKVISVIDKDQAKKLAEELVEKLDLKKIVKEKLDFLKGRVQ